MRDLLTLLTVIVLVGLASTGVDAMISSKKTIRIHIDSSFCTDGNVNIERLK